MPINTILIEAKARNLSRLLPRVTNLNDVAGLQSTKPSGDSWWSHSRIR